MEKYYPYVKKVIQFLRLEKLLQKDVRTKEAVDILYRRQDRKKIFAEIWYKRLFMLAAAILVSVMALIICLSEEMPDEVVREGRYIQPADGAEEVTFGVRAQTDEGVAEDELTLDIRDKSEVETTPVEEENTPSQKEIILSEIREEVESAVRAQRGSERIELPEMVSGKEVEYVNPVQQRDFSVYYLSLVILILLPFLWKRQREEKLREREEQLVLDYPELVNKIMLLLSAGLTVRGCFERIYEEYKKRIEEGGERRYVYEEICFSYQEMRNGVSEAEAVEAFGRRCRQISYLRFSSVMNQNMRKGSEGLTEMLEIEAAEAFEKRKETVKIMGETVGTKLLLPMMLMLVVVMAIIIVPAFMTM